MRVRDLELPGLKLIELDLHRDSRGFFVERYNEKTFLTHGLPTTYLQDNFSWSDPGVIRGLHCQDLPPQGKLVGVVAGKIWDVVVDVRPDSPTFGKWTAIELAADDGRLVWVPAGFAHGFCVLGDQPAGVLYKVDHFYNAQTERGLVWNDPDLKIAWPVARPVVSDRDANLPRFAEFCRT